MCVARGDSTTPALKDRFADRTLPVTTEIAQAWGHLNVTNPMPTVDGLLAATAAVHDLTLVTRDVKDVQRTNVRVLDPFGGPC